MHSSVRLKIQKQTSNPLRIIDLLKQVHNKLEEPVVINRKQYVGTACMYTET